MKNKKVLLRTLATALLLSGGLAFTGQTAHAAKGDVAITEENFPDSYFRGYVRKNFDKDKNGKLSLTEISKVTKIEFVPDPFAKERNEVIQYMKGLEYFTNLTELNVCDNKLMSLDISKNTKLVKLDCSHNYLTKVNVKNNPLLQELNAGSCIISTIDLTHNPELKVLYLNSNNLHELDLSKNTKLEEVVIYGNYLTGIDLSKNTKLEEVDIHGNYLTGIDLSNLKNLKKLDCCNNKIESLNIKKNTKLEELDIYKNPLNKIDIRKCPKLVEVYANGTICKRDYFTEFHSGKDDYHKAKPRISFDNEDTIVSNPIFSDVKSSDWYNAAVDYNRNSGYMSGTGAGTFSPNSKLTRAQFVCVLYNVAGKPPVKYVNKFKDVPDQKWYTNGVMWALDKKITSGISDKEFGTEKTITREQLATLLYNFAKQDGRYETKYNKKALNKFTDNGQVNSYAKEAMQWAITNGVMSGKATKGIVILDPKGEATRAECAQIIMNFEKNTMK